MFRVALIATLASLFAPFANACEPVGALSPAAFGFEAALDREFDEIRHHASAIYWVRLNSPSTMPPIFAAELCNGQHWGNGGAGPFYCAAHSLSFTVRETLSGDTRAKLELTRAQIGYVEVRRAAEIPCCVDQEEIAPAPWGMDAVAMGGCGPRVLIPGRSYVVALTRGRARFLGPVERSDNALLAGLRN